MHTLRSYFLAPFLALLQVAWAPGSAHASGECAFFQPLSLLNTQMMATLDAAPNAARSQHIVELVSDVRPDDIRQRLQQLGYSPYVAHVDTLLQGAHQQARRDGPRDLAAIQRATQSLDQLIQTLCHGDLASKTNTFTLSLQATGIWRSVFQSQNEWVRAGGIGLLTLGSVSIFLVTVFALRYVVGLFQHRKTCRIPAQLIGNGVVVKGEFTRIALHGARFVPTSPADVKQLTELIESPRFVCFDIRLPKRLIPVFVDGFHSFYAPVYYFNRLARSELADILRSSLRPPKAAPFIGHKSTRYKWRSDLARRNRHVRTADPPSTP